MTVIASSEKNIVHVKIVFFLHLDKSCFTTKLVIWAMTMQQHCAKVINQVKERKGKLTGKIILQCSVK